MRTAVIAIQNLIRLLAVLVLILGFIFWSRHGYGYVPLHVAAAVAIIVLLFLLCGLGFAARLKPGLIMGGVVWGILVLWFGFSMKNGQFAPVFPGHSYEAVRVIHFFLGLGAVGVAEAIAKRIKLSLAPAR